MSTGASTQREVPTSGAVRLGIDPVSCDGIGICAHFAADLLTVDSWGFPILPADPLSRRDLRAAKAAVSACPRRALFLHSA